MALKISTAAPILALSLVASSIWLTTKALADESHKTYNVKNYGATGDGTTDDTAAIQAAIKAAGKNTGDIVFFPGGSYLYSSALTVNGITLQGQNATLLSEDNTAQLVLKGTNPTVQTLIFQGKNAQLGSPIESNGATSPVISGSTFSSSFQYGMHLRNATNATVSNNNFIIQSAGLGVFVVDSTGTSITNNKFSAASGATGAGGVSNLAAVATTGSLNVSSNTFTGNGTANSNSVPAILSQFGTATQIFSNTITGWPIGIESLQDTSTTINSNKISNSIEAGILMAGNAGGNATGNTVDTVSKGHGIIVTGNTGAVNLVNSTISSTGRSAVFGGAYRNYLGGANLEVSGSAISNAGLSTSEKTTAVINTNQPKATAVVIVNNQYKGNTTNVSYFIDAHQAAPISQVAGNKTQTLLPTKVGP